MLHSRPAAAADELARNAGELQAYLSACHVRDGDRKRSRRFHDVQPPAKIVGVALFTRSLLTACRGHEATVSDLAFDLVFPEWLR